VGGFGVGAMRSKNPKVLGILGKRIPTKVDQPADHRNLVNLEEKGGKGVFKKKPTGTSSNGQLEYPGYF